MNLATGTSWIEMLSKLQRKQFLKFILTFPLSQSEECKW